MHPLLFREIDTYFVMWLCAATLGLALGVHRAVRAGFPATPSALALTSAVITILLGSKLLYLLEVWFSPLDDYIPREMRGALHGFRIPGGVLALALTTPPVCRLLGLPWRRFGDMLIPLAALGIVLIRLGCFLNGCCFGKVSTLPWAIAFPPESWVFWYHRHMGWVPPGAPQSLPVHPLQLYFLVAAAVTFVILLWWQRRPHASGTVQPLFYLLFFGTTAALEPLRENSLTFNNWLAPAATAGFAAASLRSLFRTRNARVAQPTDPGLIPGPRDPVRT